MYKKIIFLLIQILCLQCILPNSFALAVNLSRDLGKQYTDTTTTHSVTVNNITYKFLIHYKKNPSPHGCTVEYRDKIKEYLTETLQIFLNPTFSSDNKAFIGPVLDGYNDADIEEEYNNIDIYIINIFEATNNIADLFLAAVAIPDLVTLNDSVASGCIIINNNVSYTVAGYNLNTVSSVTPPTNDLRATIMHEFFHLIQNAYHKAHSNPTPSFFLREGTAVWAETCANITYNFKGNTITTEDKGYYKYLNGGMFENTNLGLFGSMIWEGDSTIFERIDGTAYALYPYSAVVFWKYLTERFFNEQTPTDTAEKYNARHNFKPIRKILETYRKTAYFGNEIQAYNNADPEINLPSVVKDFYTTMAIMPVMHFGNNYENIKWDTINEITYTTSPADLNVGTSNFVYKQKGNGRKKDDYAPKGFMTLMQEDTLIKIAYIDSLNPINATQTYIYEGYGNTNYNFRNKLYPTGTNFHRLKVKGTPAPQEGYSPCMAVTLQPSCLQQSVNTPNGYIPEYTENCPTIDKRPQESDKLTFFSIQIQQNNNNEIKALYIIQAQQPPNENKYVIHLQKNCFSKTTFAVYRPKFVLSNKIIDYDLTLDFNSNHCKGKAPCPDWSLPHKKDDGEYEEYDILSTFANPQTVITRSALYNIQGQLLKSWAYDINPQDIYNNYNFPLSLGFLIKENSRGERVSQLKILLK